jgi:hypothetical protein
VTKRRRNVRASARWIAHPFECDAVVREQILIRLHALTVRHPFLLRGVGASQRLEFAAQRAELFGEADVFGAEICELFCAGQL